MSRIDRSTVLLILGSLFCIIKWPKFNVEMSGTAIIFVVVVVMSNLFVICGLLFWSQFYEKEILWTNARISGTEGTSIFMSLPSAAVVAERWCFHKHLSFCPQGVGGIHPLGRHPLLDRHPLLGRPPPWVDTPSLGRHPLPGQTPPGSTPLGRHPLLSTGDGRYTPTRQTHSPGQASPPADIPSQTPPTWADSPS